MASIRFPRNHHFCHLILLFLLLNQTSSVFCFIYKVGDLASWNIPSSSNPDIYAKWSKNIPFKIGDSLFFLYPPSQDLVIQVTEQSYRACNVKDPILVMNNGNSLFNITSAGNFFFTSGAKGHCESSQKLHVYVNGSAAYDGAADLPSASGPAAADGPSSSYPNVFGSIPIQHSSSSPKTTMLSAIIGLVLSLVVSRIIYRG